MSKSFPNLTNLAAEGSAETSRRTSAGTAMRASANASEERLLGGQIAAGRESQARQEAAARDAMLRASLERQKARQHQKEMEKYSTMDWYQQQKFQTDENIRQAIAIYQAQQALAGEETDDTLPQLSDFGSAEINPYRGQALVNDGQKDFGLGDRTGYTPEERAKVASIIRDNVDNPQEVVAQVRELFGNRNRAASTALWDLGWRPA